MKRYFFITALICFICIQSMYAQTLTDTGNLTRFTGKYELQENKMFFLQTTEKDNSIILKQLWDNQEIPFKRTGSLTFYNDERSFPLNFAKNDNGKITQLIAFNRDVWIKVPDNYEPELQKRIHLNQAALKAFEGKYQLKEGDGDADDFLQIIAANDHLVLVQLWNNQKVNIWPVSAVDFFNDKQTFPIKFKKQKNGVITQLLANNKEMWVKLK